MNSVLKVIMDAMEKATDEIESDLSEEKIVTNEKKFVRAGFNAMNKMFGGFGKSEHVLLMNAWIIDMFQTYNRLLIDELVDAQEEEDEE